METLNTLLRSAARMHFAQAKSEIRAARNYNDDGRSVARHFASRELAKALVARDIASI